MVQMRTAPAKLKLTMWNRNSYLSPMPLTSSWSTRWSST
jgi:hypothetical protein